MLLIAQLVFAKIATNEKLLVFIMNSQIWKNPHSQGVGIAVNVEVLLR